MVKEFDMAELPRFADELKKSLLFDSYEDAFKAFKSSGDWEEIDPSEFSLYKIKVKGKGVFVKLFAPMTGGYASDLMRTVTELSKLKLRIPILPPLETVERMIFFETGNVIKKVYLDAILLPDEIEAINAVVVKNGLVPLSKFSGVDLVNVRGTIFIVDPVDDSNTSINDYLGI